MKFSLEDGGGAEDIILCFYNIEQMYVICMGHHQNRHPPWDLFIRKVYVSKEILIMKLIWSWYGTANYLGMLVFIMELWPR